MGVLASLLHDLIRYATTFFSILVLRSYVLARQALNYAACSDLNCFLLHLVLLVEMFVVLRLRQFDVSSHVPYSKSSPRFTPHLLIKGSRDHNIWSLQKDLLRCLSSLPKWRWCSPKDASVGRYEYRYSA